MNNLLIIVALFITHSIQAAEVNYDLVVAPYQSHVAGKMPKYALGVNGQIPAPTLKFKLGDTAVIKVQNNTNEDVTLHWHGVLVPVDMDGPETNTPPVKPGQSFTFRFPIRHTGTFWYHSHSVFQEQRGVYGAIVIEEEKPRFKVDHDFAVVMSDWTFENPNAVLDNIIMDPHYYQFKKDSFTSVLGALRHGAIWDYVKSEWERMGPMDLSDVGYDAFLINGKENEQMSSIRPGQKIRMRLINAGASTYFYANLGKLQDFFIVAKDGMDVFPIKVNEILIGNGETYDLVYDMPKDAKSIELRATAQDITGYASLFLGMGAKEVVPDKLRPNPYRMGDHGGGGGHDEHMAMAEEDMHAEVVAEATPTPGHGDHGGPTIPGTKRLEYRMLKALKSTAFSDDLVRHDVKLELDGDMERFLWTINGKTMAQETEIMIRYNEVVRFTMVNKTMMHHPMHLHGHFFRVLNGQDDKSPLFHTVDVAPMATVTIEFHANEPGIWFFHCHNLYHMKMGMARLVRYEGFVPHHQHDGKEMKKDHGNALFINSALDIYTNRGSVTVNARQGWYDVELELELNKYQLDNLEVELVFKRYLDKYLALMAGAEFEDSELKGLIGIAATLPLLIEMETSVRTDGVIVVKLRKEIPLAKKLTLDLEPRFDIKAKPSFTMNSVLKYQLAPNWFVGINYHYSEEVGNTVGVGTTVRFR